MKKFKLRRTAAIIGYMVLAVVLFYSCEGVDNDKYPSDNYEIKVIDECEYIYVSRRPWDGSFALTHKGNCKYCKARSLNNH